jgi:hypothetical protein
MEMIYLRVAGGSAPCWRDPRSTLFADLRQDAGIRAHLRPVCPSKLQVQFGGYGCTLPKDHERTHVASIGRDQITAEWSDHYAADARRSEVMRDGTFQAPRARPE